MFNIRNHKKTEKIPGSKSGFTLLISIVTTSILLLISFIVVNITLKQLVLMYSSQQSQYAFYNAESGIECAMFWDFKVGPVSAFDTSVSTTTPSCNNQTFSSGGSTISNFTINLTKGCVVVTVDKSVSNVTTISSKGYNTCTSGALRRFERGIITTY